ncbi:MAG: HD domain-containing protein [Treponema sp.]|jgi:GTP pyrophosphokinase|nr:HD domain-containing protein [Treponema sp.]
MNAAEFPGFAEFSRRIGAYSPEDRERILEASRMTETADPRTLARQLGTAAILIELNLDAEVLIAAMIRHRLAGADAPADAAAREEAAEELGRRFGEETLALAEDSVKIARIAAPAKTVQEAGSLRKMHFVMVRDIRAILIKLADKLYALRTLEEAVGEARKVAAQECLDLYAPLAGRLGISWLKDEMEDLCLKHLNRDVYLHIKEIVALKRGERSDFLDLVRERIAGEAKAAGFNVEVQSRAKHFYSIYQKMRKRNKAAGEMYDLFGLRILCDAVDQCYALLGLVHRLWKPLDGRFKDYIAMPKPNGYRSLHTTVLVSPGINGETAAGGEEGRTLEIQIRTREMHRTAEYGVAGHWLYKRGEGYKKHAAPGEEENFAGLTLEGIKRELLGNRVYVFTPQGKVVELPAGATPLDFAFAIHTSIGERCLLAKADGAVIPLSSPLKSTQVVEIVTAANARPSENWLRSVKTARARNKIRAWLQRNGEGKNQPKKKEEEGKIPAKPGAKAEEKAPDQGSRGETEKQRVVQRRGIFKVKVEDEKNMMFRFAKCCNPALGDSITGYVSRGRGIIIHRRDCSNLGHIPDFNERRIDAQWENTGMFLKRFKITARFRENLFSEIEGVVRKFQGHLVEGRLDETEPNRLTGYFTMRLENREDVRRVLKHLRGIPAVSNIQGLG